MAAAPVPGSRACATAVALDPFLTRTTLRKESAVLRTALLTRSPRTAADGARILELEVAGQCLMVFPPASVPPVSRLTTDGSLLAAVLESGRTAMHAICDWQQRPGEEFPIYFSGND